MSESVAPEAASELAPESETESVTEAEGTAPAADGAASTDAATTTDPTAPDRAATPSSEGGSSRQVKAYDFQRHEAMDRHRLRRLAPVLEVAAHRMTQALTSIVRGSVKVEIAELEQKRWEVFANSMPEPTFIATASVSPVGGRIGLHFPLSSAQAIVECRLGGAVTGVVHTRAITDIEMRLFEEAVLSVVEETFAALAVVIPMTVGTLTTSSSAVLVQMPNPSEICLLVNLKIVVEELSSFEATMTFPLSMLMALLDALEHIDGMEVSEPDSMAAEVRARLMEAPVDVSVDFPEIVLSTDELLTLSVGDVISLQRPEGLPLRLNVSDVHYCDVVATTKGKRLACMVVESKPKEDQ